MTPLLPCRPAILSPTDSLRFIATYTLTSLITPGRQLVAAPDLLLLLLEELADHLDLALGALLELPQVVLQPRVVGGNPQPDHRVVRHLLQDLGRQHRALRSSRSRPNSSNRSVRSACPCSIPTTRFFTSS